MEQQQQIDATLLIDELKAQRNALADQMALAGALIQALRKQITEMEEKNKSE